MSTGQRPTSNRHRKTLLLVTQVYVPDPAAVGQYMHDVAARMTGRGWRVIVYTSDRGYADPSIRYPRREVRDGVEIRRLRFSSFGKGSIVMRLLGGMLFLLQAMFRAMWLRRIDAVLMTTSPPMGGAAGVFLRLVRRARVCFWSMDLNPDQFVALGYTRPTSLPARAFDALNRAILRTSAEVVTLDSFMASRLRQKHDPGCRLKVLAPWPPVERMGDMVAHGDNPFRRQHGLDGRFVLMYSGNVSPSHPMTTVLEAVARVQRDDPRLVMVVISGGPSVGIIRKFAATTGADIRILPYQPLDRLRYSLSAADVHLVSMGNPMVGINHPSKVYGAMAVGRPILYLGPRPSHISAMMDEFAIGWQVRHDDIDSAESALRQMLALNTADLQSMGLLARDVIRDRYSRASLLSSFCDIVEGHATADSLAPAAVTSTAPSMAAGALQWIGNDGNDGNGNGNGHHASGNGNGRRNSRNGNGHHSDRQAPQPAETRHAPESDPEPATAGSSSSRGKGLN